MEISSIIISNCLTIKVQVTIYITDNILCDSSITFNLKREGKHFYIL